MAVMEGTSRRKTWIGYYDFAVDGGAVSAITLRSNDGPIPTGSYIEGGIVEVLTALNSSGSATAALSVEGANDLVTATAFGSAPWSSTGRKSVVPVNTGATSIKTTAARNPVLTVATAALTGGKLKVVLEYV